MRPLECPLNGVQLIEASAGTGKTFTIASLYLRLILGYQHKLPVADPRKILVVTFTRAATQELRSRIRQRLLDARELLALLARNPEVDDLSVLDLSELNIKSVDTILAELCFAQSDRAQAVERLNGALKLLDEAAIFTIHGFCQKVLGSFALEVGVPFQWRVSQDIYDLHLDAVRDYWRHRFYGADIGLVRAVQDLWASPEALLAELKAVLDRPGALVQGICDRPVLELHEEVVENVHILQKLWKDSEPWLLEMAERFKLKKTSYAKNHHPKRIQKISFWLENTNQFYNPPDALKYFTLGKVQELSIGSEPVNEPLFEVAEKCFSSNSLLRESILGEALSEILSRTDIEKVAQGVLSFDDLLRLTSQALHSASGTLLGDALRESYPVALIDEFQDTDSLQWDVFSTVYQDRSDVALLLIGDPKQAIYSFRGADIRTYIAAKHLVPTGARHNLLENFRSTVQLIEGVNALFSSVSDPFLAGQDIGFEPSVAPVCSSSIPAPLVVDGKLLAAFNVFSLDDAGDVDDGESQGSSEVALKGPSKVEADILLAEQCAQEISRLLQGSARGNVTIDGRKLEARDIAVLTRSNYQAQLIQNSLRRRGVPAVYLGRNNIYETEEALDLLRILEAVARPYDLHKVRAALASAIFGYSALDLRGLLREGKEWEESLATFYECHDLWGKRGFLPMFWLLLKRFRIPERILDAKITGARRLTNLLHLGEHLQKESEEFCGGDSLCSRLNELVNKSGADSDAGELRLETDEKLLNIVTIHRSKGLQYELVFLPFLGGGVSKGGYATYYDREQEKQVVDLSPSKQRSDEIAELINREALAEDLRLLYVALTRAKRANFLFLADTKNLRVSAFAHLLGLNGDKFSLGAVRERLERIAGSASCAQEAFCFCAVQAGEKRIVVPSVQEPSHGLAARDFRGSIDARWRVTSYSAISKGLLANESFRRHDAELAIESRSLGVGPRQDVKRSIHTLTKGPITGNALHAILERVNGSPYSVTNLEKVVEEELTNAGLGAEWATVVSAQLQRLMEQRLEMDKAFPSFSLADISVRSKRSELEFDLRVGALSISELKEVLSRLTGVVAVGGGGVGIGPLGNEIHGILHGFIDLVVEVGERFYIFDYKTNYLGPSQDAYARESMEQAMLSHNYHLQYLFYTLALHRMLKVRRSAYSYEKNFGGVYYLFLRGLGEAGQEGIYFSRPAAEVIEKLDSALEGR